MRKGVLLTCIRLSYTGALGGGLFGAVEGFRTKPVGSLDSSKLKLNRVINACMHRGKTFGNTFGILGLFFAVSESFALSQLGHTLPDELSSVLAGMMTGALYRSSAGPKSIALGGAMGGMAVAALVLGRNVRQTM